jgi:hypothetical protein
VDVELCPRLTVAGIGADAEMEKSAPVEFSSTLTVLSSLTVTKSGALSPSRSAVAAIFKPEFVKLVGD